MHHSILRPFLGPRLSRRLRTPALGGLRAGLVILLALVAGCDSRSPDPGSGAAPTSESPAALDVFVSIPPQSFLIREIGGPHVRVHTLLGPGQSPHTFDPTARQVVELGEADVYFRIGIPFETALVDRIASALEGLEIVDLSAGIERQLMDSHEDTGGEDADDHAHDEEPDSGEGDAHHHDENELDPHIWMSPRIVMAQAETVERTLCRLDPDNCTDFGSRAQDLRARLEALDREIAAALAPLAGREFFVFHPAFGYFAQAYGLKQVAIQTGGKQPSARQIQHIIDRARSTGVEVIFVQPQFDRSAAEVIAGEIGGAVVPVDPLSDDYINNLRSVAEAVRQALQSQGESEPASTLVEGAPAP